MYFALHERGYAVQRGTRRRTRAEDEREEAEADETAGDMHKLRRKPRGEKRENVASELSETRKGKGERDQ